MEIFSSILIGLLVFIVILQGFERYFFAEQMQKQQEKLMTAFLSRDATQYAQAVKTEREPTEPLPESDEVLESEASNETFNKMIERMNS